MSEFIHVYRAFDIDNFIFKKENKIGKGSFGKVYKVEEKDTGKLFAAKVIDFESITPSGKVDLEREITINAKLSHPAIIKFIGFSPVDFKKKNRAVIVTEYLPKGSLNKYIEYENKSIPIDGWDMTKKLIIIYGIAAAMSFLHSNNIIHRDLKPENILLDDSLFPKITDFGLSKSCDSNTTQSLAGIKGTPLYCAPEVLNKGSFSPAGDVYSFSLIVYEIMTSANPFRKLENIYQLIAKVSHGERPDIDNTIPDSYRRLIVDCWSQDPKDRPTFDGIVSRLKEESGFITKNVNEDEFLDYVDLVDNNRKSFEQRLPCDVHSPFQRKTVIGKPEDQIKVVQKSQNEKGDDSDITTQESSGKSRQTEYSYSDSSDQDSTRKDEIQGFSQTDESKTISLVESHCQHRKITKSSSFQISLSSGKTRQIESSYSDSYDQGNTKKDEINEMPGFSQTDESKTISLVESHCQHRKLTKSSSFQISLSSGKTRQIESSYSDSYDLDNTVKINQSKNNVENAIVSQYKAPISPLLKPRSKFLSRKIKLVDSSSSRSDSDSDGFKISKIQARKRLSPKLQPFKTPPRPCPINIHFDESDSDESNEASNYYEKSDEANATPNNDQNKEVNNAPDNDKNKEANTTPVNDKNNKELTGVVNTKESEEWKRLFPSKTEAYIPKQKKDRSPFGKRTIKSVGDFNKNSILPIDIFIYLSDDCQSIVNAAQNDPNRQYFLAVNLINGTGGFQQSTEYGISCLERSIKGNCVNSILYYCQILTEGKLVPKNVDKAKKILKDHMKIDDSHIYLTYARLMMDENNIQEAKKYYFKAAEKGNGEAQYEYGIVIWNSKQKNFVKDAAYYIKMSKFNGYSKGELFLTVLNELEKIFEFTSLHEKIQFFFISKLVGYCKNIDQRNFKLIPILIDYKSVDKFDKYDFFQSTGFESLLKYFNDFSIEISLLSKKYNKIIKIIAKKKMKVHSNLNVILSIYNIKDVDAKLFYDQIPDGIEEKKVKEDKSEFEYNLYKSAWCIRHNKITYKMMSSVFNKVVIDSSVQSLNSMVFSGCNSITEIFIPPSIKSIGESCFSFCNSLVHVTIPSSVTFIERRTFSSCLSLKEIIIPSSVRVIEERAFSSCESLVNVSLPMTIEKLGDGCFENCSSLKSLKIPTSLMMINALTFSSCTSLVKISIPPNVVAIKDYAFFGCTSLVEVDMPKSLKSIGEKAFYNCCSLTNFIVPASIVSISSEAFFGCKTNPQTFNK